MHSSRVDISIRNLKWELIWCERITEKKHVLALCGGCTSSVRSFEGPLLPPRVAPPTKMIKKSEKIKRRVTLGEASFRVWVSPPARKDFFSFCALCNFGTVLIIWSSVYAKYWVFALSTFQSCLVNDITENVWCTQIELQSDKRIGSNIAPSNE